MSRFRFARDAGLDRVCPRRHTLASDTDPETAALREHVGRYSIKVPTRTKLNETRVVPIDRSMLAPPSAALMQFVRQRGAQPAGATELRRSKRFPVVLEVVVVPLNEHFRPSGLPFLAVTRDVSTGGLCMLHTRPSPSPKLFVEIERPNEPALDVVLNVRRNRRVAQFFEIAGNFMPIGDEALAAARARVATRRPESPV